MALPRAIQDIMKDPTIGELTTVKGWVTTHRGNKQIRFIKVQDGSTQNSLQVVVATDSIEKMLLKEITTGSVISVTGLVVRSRGAEQGIELQAERVKLLGKAGASYPLQPKKHSMEFLRDWQHLRFRTQTFGAIFRIRHTISQAIHSFFSGEGFYWVHTPIITSNDAEGAGELFEVENREATSADHFFGAPVGLTVSGQLTAEAAAMGLGKVYTFGPTFRAENTNTARHLSEFWMVEPEMAFYDLADLIELAKRLLQHIAQAVEQERADELIFLEKRREEPGGVAAVLHSRLALLQKEFIELSYTEAVALLKAALDAGKVKFTYPVQWGMDLQTEHERYLTHYFKAPVIVKDYPAAIKAFYMKQNKDQKTVAAMDILLPGIGEIIGGSQREEEEEKLMRAIEQKKIDPKKLQWYIDLRRFGSVVHSGFGLGLERITQFITGMENIRDVIPFPRTPGRILG